MSVDMNKTIAEASLNNLHDIVLPEAVGFFPLAPGWYILLLLFLTLLFHFALKHYRIYKKEQYRREAFESLAELQQKNRENTLALLSLAKRVGLSAYGRESIAILNGEDWWDFIEEHSKAKVDSALRKEIQILLYQDAATFNESTFDAVLGFVTEWISTHKVVTHV